MGTKRIAFVAALVLLGASIAIAENVKLTYVYW